MAADYIFVNGEVITVNIRNEITQAVAVSGNRILAVGRREEVLALQGEKTTIMI